MRSERKFFLSEPEVCFSDATRFVRLVLTGVRVANFFNIANFSLIFYTTLITGCPPICWSVFHSYLSVLSVLVLKVCMWERLSICTSVCLSSYRPVLLHCLSVFLFVCACLCMSVRLYFCLSVCVFAHLSCC
jgi:hypothetical protein